MFRYSRRKKGLQRSKKKCILYAMAIKERKTHRFREAGKVSIPELCIFPGLLIDISSSGCCIRFPAVIEPDMDSDYEASFVLSSKSPQHPVVLIVQPKWKKMPSRQRKSASNFCIRPVPKIWHSTYRIFPKPPKAKRPKNRFIRVPFIRASNPYNNTAI